MQVRITAYTTLPSRQDRGCSRPRRRSWARASVAGWWPWSRARPACLVLAGPGRPTAPRASVNRRGAPRRRPVLREPAILQDIAAGGCSTTVYVTSGDAGAERLLLPEREPASGPPTPQMAGVTNNWTTSPVTFAGKSVTAATLIASPAVQLYFMNLPDGFADGAGSARSDDASLEKLYHGQVTHDPQPWGPPRQTYTRAEVVDTLGRHHHLPAATAVRTLDFGWASSGTVTTATTTPSAGSSTTPARRYLPGAPISRVPRLHDHRAARRTSRAADLQAKRTRCSPTPRSTRAPAGRGSSAPTAGRALAGAGAHQHREAGDADGHATWPATATATASSENGGDGQTAAKAIDGVIAGYPGDHTAEWATRRVGVPAAGCS